MKLDKLYHFIVGMFIQILTASFLLVLISAISKEVYDQIDYKGFDWLDLIATLLGGILIKILVSKYQDNEHFNFTN